MLFCFGLFALLLYYTVVANAECSYTYRNSSQHQHIEAQSTDLESQGFKRCEFLIQLVNDQQQVRLNFTRLSGFGLRLGTKDGQSVGQRGEEKEEKKEGTWEELGRGDSGDGREEEGQGAKGKEKQFHRIGERTSSRAQSPVDVTFATRNSVAMESAGSDSKKLSSIVSSPTPLTAQLTSTAATALVETNSSSYSKTVTEHVSTISHQGPSLHRGKGREPCLPMVEIREVVDEGHEETRDRICHQRHNTQTPIVFHYASSVRIVYEWEQRHNSGFTVYFEFSNSQHEGKCIHTCDGFRCLTESHRLCDGHADCHDQSDEQRSSCDPSTTPSQSIDADSAVKIILITSSVAIVMVLGVLCLVVRQRLVLNRTMHSGIGHATQLTCPQSHRFEGLTPSACSTQECNEQVVALLPSNHHSQKSWHPYTHTLQAPPHSSHDPEIGLPPNIPVSPDGEEGYSTSQLRLLHPRYHSAHTELFKPPPNKTVYDRESPPPYSLNPSTRSYGCGSAPSPSSPLGMERSEYLPGQSRVGIVQDSEGHPTVSRSMSMLTSPGHHHHQSPTIPTLWNDCSQRDIDSPSNGFTSHYYQQSPHVHGAFTVDDKLRPTQPPPLLLDCPMGTSSPLGHLVSQTVMANPPFSLPVSGAWDRGKASADSVSDFQGKSYEGTNAPPRYHVTFCDRGGGNTVNNLNVCPCDSSPVTTGGNSGPPTI